MAQRYHDDTSHRRMAAENCPECGEPASEHVNDNRFWIPRRCDLLPHGVTERIEQHQADRAAEGEQR